METSIFLGELVGTAVLILLGNGVVANVLLKNTKGNNSGLIIITTGWAMAVTFAVFIAQKLGSAGAHLNPALTLAFGFKSGDWSSTLSYLGGQFLGATLGSVLVYIFYKDHYDATDDSGAIQSTFFTSPAIPNAPFNFISEAIGTLILYLGVSAIAVENGSGMGPFLVGMLVLVIGNALGGTTGYAINPFRDLVPRLVHAVLPIKNKGGSNWDYAWVPVLGPIVGAISGTLIM